MAHILHLSDLHLSSDTASDVIADAKAAAIPAAMQQTSTKRLISTLEALARDLDAADYALDCIVLSGDIVDKNDESAYEMLPRVLAPLVPQHVPADRVVVVPGNHDVRRGSLPSSNERWDSFLRLRSFGYVTPLLEGVDIDDGGVQNETAASPVLTALDGSFTLVAVNSANHCQTVLSTEPQLDIELDRLREMSATDAGLATILEHWDERSIVDVCWIGDGQLKAAARALTASTRGAAPSALRLAVIHHNMLPTGAVAEVKAFESMLNLGEFLDWITDNRIDVVLHGHKHTNRDFPIDHTAFHSDGHSEQYRTLLMGAPSARADQQHLPIARLMTIEPRHPRTGGVRVRDLPAVESGGRIQLALVQQRVTRLDPAINYGRVSAVTAEEVHEMLLSLDGDYANIQMPLTCRIDDGDTARSIPANYPDVPAGVLDVQRWFTETVEWWQKRRVGRAARFNHGHRLRAFGGSPSAEAEEGLDQVRLAADALRRKPESTRAIAILVDPTTDLATNLGPAEKEFPAFVLVQFSIENSLLHVTGYFRKQEMPHWWPINVAELNYLQREVIRQLPDRGLSAGSITTITSQPVSGGGVPLVAISSLDARLDRPNGILELVLPLFRSTLFDEQETLAAWHQAFDDWAPSAAAAADHDPMPIAGLAELLVGFDDMSAIYGGDSVRELVDQVKLMQRACFNYVSKTDGSRTQARAQWLAEVTTVRERIFVAVSSVLRSR